MEAKIETKLKKLLSNFDLETTSPKLWIDEYFNRQIYLVHVVVETKISHKKDDESFVFEINQARDKFLQEINRIKHVNFRYYETYQDELDKELDELLEWTKEYIKQYPNRKVMLERDFNMRMLYFLRHLFYCTCFLIFDPDVYPFDYKKERKQIKQVRKFKYNFIIDYIGNLVIVDYYLEKCQIDEINHYYKQKPFQLKYSDLYYSDWVLTNCIISEIRKNEERDGIVDMHKCEDFKREDSDDYDFRYAFEERLLRIESALKSLNNDKPYSIYNLKNLKSFSFENLYKRDLNFDHLARYSFEKLEKLEFDSFDLTKLKSNFFDTQPGFRNLLELDLSKNYMDCWRFGMLWNLKSLKSLSLHKTKLSNLPFAINRLNLPNLERFDLSCSNHFARDPVRFNACFQKFENLKFLDLSNSQIKYINKKVFIGLRSLKELKLNLSQIKHIEQGSFSDLFQLETLDLSQNQLQHVDNGLFLNLINLKKLDISSNSITNFNPAKMLNSVKLEELIIGDNEFRVDDKGSLFVNFSNLRLLNISGLKANKLSKEMLNGLSSLKILKAYNNNFVTIDDQTFEHLKDLEILGLASNQKLNSLSAKCFNGLSKLRELDLCNCGLTEIQMETFNDLTQLEHLNLSSNKLISIHYNRFCKLINLKFLNINYNFIKIQDNLLEIIKIKWMSIINFEYESQLIPQPNKQ